MRIALAEHDPKQEWQAGLNALVAQLSATPGWMVVRDDSAADAWLISAGDSRDYERLLATRDHKQLRRTILLGVSLEWKPGIHSHPAGSFPDLLETNRLGGAFTPPALTDWQELPSYFAGPIELMEHFHTNGIKSMQSDHYVFWGCTPGNTLAAFLVEYLPELVKYASSPD